ncbi:MAG: hypothetical protein ACRD9L_08575, partial [Bryobacteraceae bacterium]
MYSKVLEKERPQKAAEEVFQHYAQRPAWYLEEAASLVAGYVPRKHLHYSPMCPTNDFDEQAAPDSNWYYLLRTDAPVGRIIDCYLQAQGIGWSMLDQIMVEPWALIGFCDEYRIQVPPPLRNAVLLIHHPRREAPTHSRQKSVEQRRRQIAECARATAPFFAGTSHRLPVEVLLKIFRLMPGFVSHAVGVDTFRKDLKVLESTVPE